MDRRFLRHFAQYVTHSHLLSQQFQLLHSATFHATSLIRAATRQSASTQTVTFSHDKRCNQKSPMRFSHYLCHIRESASSAHRHSVTPRRPPPPCATIPAARILYPSHGSTPRADTTIHNRQPSATLECVTRCLTCSLSPTPRSYHHQTALSSTRSPNTWDSASVSNESSPLYIYLYTHVR